MNFRRLFTILLVPLIAVIGCLPFVAYAEKDSTGQNRIVKETPLLNEKGELTEPGYCFTNMFKYDRSAIKASPLTIKEWNFYEISNERYILLVMIADVSYGATTSVILHDMETGEQFAASSTSLLTFGRYGVFDTDAMAPSVISKHKKNYNLDITTADGYKTIVFNGKTGKQDYKVDVRMDMFPNHESLTFAVPLVKNNPKKFYLDQKINCMPVTGTVTIGDRVIEFSPEDTFAILDWGRGAWPYHSSWYWCNGSKRLDNGDIFGFELGWGFGDENICTENTIFYNGKAQKLGKITLEKGRSNWMIKSDWTGTDWVLKSDDGRLNLTMTPVYDNFTCSRVIFVGNWCHQVFGRFNGTVKLDDGTVLEIKDMMAFCEKADNLY